MKNFFTLFVRYYECISLLDCILIGSKVKSGLSVIISSFHLLGPALGRNTDSPHSTSQQAGLSVEKVHQVGRTVSDSSKKISIECRRSSEIALIFTLIHLVIGREN